MSRKDLKYRGTKCINCETPIDVSEKYCHACGQLNSTKMDLNFAGKTGTGIKV